MSRSADASVGDAGGSIHLVNRNRFYRRPGSSEMQKIESVEGNYQRLRRHRFAPVDVQAIRLHVTGMNGLDAVMIQEMRCYG